ncbi:glycosyl hydrolase family 76 [Mucilaginibacter hurinus]|uniref:Glycosyl hydrolase family 76 n=1 Tax=Mucilaginibacter hurinus TaxID=2201324 RepID=A0A367GR01_9SPHI|nr:glycoside hydrolase family 76 protein [Mucilaginibacter hurinus]RCH55296.1 glycosyl hydrolase family 76 [Mucilaginibacter hurinus]
MKIINKLLIAAGLLPLALSSCKDEAFPLYGNQNQRPPVNYTWAGTADSLQNKLNTSFLSGNAKYYVLNDAGNTTFHYWPNAHVLDVLTDAYMRTDDEVYAQRMKSLLNGIKESNGNTFSNNFYDDMEWLALSSLRAYELTDDATYLDAANFLWTDIKTGINDNQGGGIAWRKTQLDYKNTPANAPAIIFAARLSRVNNNEEDLNIAISLYNWLAGKLLDSGTGLAWDGVNSKGDGQIDKNLYTYNQGIFMGAALELYRSTNDAKYLDAAWRNAEATMKSPALSPGGIMKAEGGGDGGLFKGVLVRYLTLLAQEEGLPAINRNEIVKYLKFNAETLYTNGIARPSMKISPDWSKKETGPTDLTVQLSGMMLIEAAAQLNKANLF